MNLELIKHSVDTYEFNSPEEETETILKQIRDAKKELELIKTSLHSGIAFMHRTGDDEGLQEAYTDLDAFLNPEIYEPTHSSDPAVDYEKEYTSKYSTYYSTYHKLGATIEADGEVTYSND